VALRVLDAVTERERAALEVAAVVQTGGCQGGRVGRVHAGHHGVVEGEVLTGSHEVLRRRHCECPGKSNHTCHCGTHDGDAWRRWLYVDVLERSDSGLGLCSAAARDEPLNCPGGMKLRRSACLKHYEYRQQSSVTWVQGDLFGTTIHLKPTGPLPS
jgi:hypothetical protein